MKRSGDGLRGTSRDTKAAFATTVFFRRVRFQFERRDDFGKENPVAKLAADQVGVLADESESGAFGQVAFQQRTGIDIPQRARAFAAKLVHKAGQLFQSFTEHVVVIGEAGVTGDDSTRLRVEG